MIDFLLTNATIITMNPGREVLENSSLAIDQGRILAIGPAVELEQKYPATRVINARRKIIMPGLVDCHGHRRPFHVGHFFH